MAFETQNKLPASTSHPVHLFVRIASAELYTYLGTVQVGSWGGYGPDRWGGALLLDHPIPSALWKRLKAAQRAPDWILEDFHGRKQFPSSVEHLTSMLAELGSGSMWGVVLRHSDGESMTALFSKNVAHVMHELNPGDSRPGRTAEAAGDVGSLDFGPVVGESTPIARSLLVRKDQAIEALVHFMEKRKATPSLIWSGDVSSC